MVKQFILGAILLASLVGKAQNKQDAQAIKAMCGCYEVTFHYQELFSERTDSAYVPSKTSKQKALEWVEVIEENKQKISLQHLLIVGKGEKQHIIKHWRQDWLYQNTDFYQYTGENLWKYETLSPKAVKGQWTQKVFQVDDSPRYEGFGVWVHTPQKSFWENETFAPLPRREEEQRKDYNLLLRRNRHEITPYGWLHQQHNSKIIRENGKKDFVLAQEFGYNTYKKVENSQCASAEVYWQKNKDRWALVRQKWNEVFSKNKDLKLLEKVDNQTLFDVLFDENFNKKEEIDALIEKYIVK